MIRKKNILAIIPARGGSKGIPRKNIKLLFGKPLISYSITEALKSIYINKVIVSTEDSEIAKISQKYGAEVLERPNELATDTADSDEVIFHVLQELKKKHFRTDLVVFLQPTSPLRRATDIDTAIKIFCDHDCDSVISVSEPPHSPFWCFTIENTFLKPIFDERFLHTRRQDLPVSYIPNGAIYISTPEKLTHNNGFYGKKIIPYIMSPETSIDIDNRNDFAIAEMAMKQRE